MHCPNCKTNLPDEPQCPFCGNEETTANEDVPKIKDGVTLKQVLDLKEEAEFRIMEQINKEMRGIRRETGVPVKRVEVDLTDITKLGSRTSEYAIRDVNLKLDLSKEKGE